MDREGEGRPSYKCHPRGRRKTRPVIDRLRFVSGLAADLVRRRVEVVAYWERVGGGDNCH